METVLMKTVIFKLRNIAPRQGTETFVLSGTVSTVPSARIEKHSSPTGDGNSAAAVTIHAVN